MLQRGPNDGAGAGTDGNPFPPRQVNGGAVGVIISDGNSLIDDGTVENLRYVLFGKTGDALHTGQLVVRGRRFDADNLDFRVLLLEEATHAGNCAAGTITGKEMGDLARGLLPDFRSGTLVVRLHIELVFILVGTDIVIFGSRTIDQGVHQSARAFGGVQGTHSVIRLPQFHPEQPQHNLLLFGDFVRHGDFNR